MTIEALIYNPPYLSHNGLIRDCFVLAISFVPHLLPLSRSTFDDALSRRAAMKQGRIFDIVHISGELIGAPQIKTRGLTE